LEELKKKNTDNLLTKDKEELQILIWRKEYNEKALDCILEKLNSFSNDKKIDLIKEVKNAAQKHLRFFTSRFDDSLFKLELTNNTLISDYPLILPSRRLDDEVPIEKKNNLVNLKKKLSYE